jgi:hypothetical protein
MLCSKIHCHKDFDLILLSYTISESSALILHSEPCTLHPEPCTLNPNPQPLTRRGSKTRCSPVVSVTVGKFDEAHTLHPELSTPNPER